MPTRPTPPRVAALLAAGGGTRFAGTEHKLLADLNCRPIWAWALDHVLAAGFDHIVVVTGAVALDLPVGVTERHNPDWAAGQAGSVQVAVRAAAALGAEAVTIGLADQPFVPAETWRAVSTADPAARIVIAVYEGVPGPNPVRLASEVWSLLPTEGDAGARELIRAHPAWVSRIESVGSAADIDTLEDLTRWRSC